MPKDVLIKNKNGLSLVELILAMTLFALIAAAIIALIMGAYSANLQSAQLTKATAYLQESQEAVRAISKEAWNYLEVGSYGLVENGGKWELNSSPDIIEDTFTRTITIEEGDPATDLYRRKITTTLDWAIWEDRQTSISAVTYLNNWDSQDWTQTDWSGGSGQVIYSASDRYLRDNGKVDTSTAGQLSLASRRPGRYYKKGVLVSSFYGPYSNFNILKWTETIPPTCATCEVKVRFRTAPDAGGVPGRMTRWSKAYTTASGILIPQSHIGNAWIQYKIILKGRRTQTPILEDITINYYE